MEEAGDIVLDQTEGSNHANKERKTRPSLKTDAEAAERRRLAKVAQKEYGRGRQISYKSAKDKKLRGNLQRIEEKFTDAAVKAKNAEILLENEAGYLEPEGELERTYKVRQDELLPNVAIETARKGFELTLNDLGPYRANYTRNGRHLVLAGRKGHVATMDWRDGKLGCELQLGETVRVAKWLHNEQFFAVAQKKYVYIYDSAGLEIHCLKKHVEVTEMEFLPYHFLLATIGMSGYLKYQDTSTGQIVAEISTKKGSPTSLTQNPSNAVVHVGHQNGTVTLWSPNSTASLVTIQAHRGPVRSLSVDREGRYMVSVGQDMKMSVWDIRTFKEVNKYFTRQPGSSVTVSDKGVVGVGWGTSVTMWRGLFDKALEDQVKVRSPYMTWGGEGKRIEGLSWCPFEDVLGVSHDKGFSSILVPGAGEANFDAMEINPYETKKQRQENEVNSLLNKLQPEMISLNPNVIGTLDVASHEQRQKEKDLDRPAEDPIAKLKNRSRGKNSSLRKYLRKRGSRNIIDERRLKIEALRKKTNAETSRAPSKKEELGPALARFAKKGR